MRKSTHTTSAGRPTICAGSDSHRGKDDHSFLGLIAELLVEIVCPPHSLKPQLLDIKEACLNKPIQRKTLKLLGKVSGNDLMTIFSLFSMYGFGL